ncbi:tyrosine-protein phosphatase 10D-like [Mya arenaria]|uniref:tyrosine-protein phosphatase 10D-like n=1 Tax=Mya arenaria TaxID=6604 RepID=UPI0022E2E94F|nr:tyrosine-protein phosphatase 10D-like [Mya arenaria]
MGSMHPVEFVIQVKLPLDSPCLQPDACATAHSVCLQKKCQCSENYYNTNDANQYKKTCKSKHYLNEKCDDEANPNQCKDDKAECSNSNNMKLCRCIAGYHEEKGVCIANKALGEECDVSTECSDSAAVCTGSNKVCTCGSNHYDDNAFSAGGNCQEISQLQVSSITFSQVHTTTMIVSWTPQSGKARFISDYTVQWGSNDSSIAEGFKENIMSTTTKITGLTPGQNYRITVTSVNKVTQADSPRSTFVSKQRSSKPMPPNSLDLDGSNLDATDKEITLAWTRPSSGVVSRYDIEVLDGTELKQTTFAVGTASATLTFYDMRNGYTYNVKIIYRSETYDGTNTEPSQPFESPFKTDVQVPDPPTDVSCLSIYDEYITLSWTAPQKPNGDLVQYVVHTLSYPSNSEKFQNNTSSTGTTYDVHGLEPGTAYVFRVHTQNEGHTSTQYGAVQTFCTTKAKMADKPQNLNFVNNITSRALSVTWSEPVNIYSSENLGYIVQLQDNDANMCEKEIVMRCSNCTTGDIKKITMPRCGQDLQVQIDQSHDEIRANKLYTIQSLLPDTNYIVSVSVVNNQGRGNAASIDIKTPEEEPQAAPVVRSVYDIRKNSFNVSWSLIGPRPGQVTYTVILTADTGADSKSYYVTGYGNTNLYADGLEEYWNYDVSVTARTNVGGAKTSDTTTKNRTLPSAPGAVTEFEAVKVQLRTDNFHKMTIQWKAPLLLQRNSVIKEYVLRHNVGNTTASSVGDEEFKTMSFTSVTSDVFYSQEFDVIPESTYKFEVHAVNTESTDNMGEKTAIKEIAPAGFPVSIEEADKTLQVVKEGSKDQTFISLNLVREFFTEETNGRVQRTALLGCKSSACPENFLGYADTQKKVDALANWQKAAQNSLYRITTADWLTKNKGSRRSKYTEVPYTVGIENCDGVTEGTYCNGPLEPETEYLFVAVVCTSTGCTVSKKYGPYITEAVPPPIGMIVGIMAGVVAALVVVVIVVFFLRRRSRNKVPPMSTIPDGSLVEVEIGEMIQRKRPILLSEFDAYLTMMHKDSNLKFSDEYKELKTLSPKHSTVASLLKENRAKNRYINIIPYDHSRVKLTTNGEDDKNDFINGNYLPGYLSPREYIGCQGPLPATIDDHWRMIWEQNVTIIVMLTLCKEGKKIKCEQYWPDEVGDPKQYGEVVVEMTSYSNIKTYDFRVFKIRNGSQTRTIKHFHFLTWQDFQANVKHDTILNFIRDVRHQIQPPDKAGPMIVHCSAGVGRTGTYLAIDYFMQFIDEHDFDVEIDIFDFVLRMRDNRIFMVQTEEQYVFIHDCVKEMLDSKRLAENNLYENTGGNQEGDLFQNTSQQLYENVQYNSSDQRTEL